MKPKILIAEDDASLGKLYETALKSRGFRVLWAKNGEEALMMAEKKAPDLILLDIMMPEMHGLNVLKILKSDSKLKKLKIIMITALDDQKTRQKAMKLGACDYIIKSQSNMGEIIKKIAKELD